MITLVILVMVVITSKQTSRYNYKIQPSRPFSLEAPLGCIYLFVCFFSPPPRSPRLSLSPQSSPGTLLNRLPLERSLVGRCPLRRPVPGQVTHVGARFITPSNKTEFLKSWVWHLPEHFRIAWGRLTVEEWQTTGQRPSWGKTAFSWCRAHFCSASEIVTNWWDSVNSRW